MLTTPVGCLQAGEAQEYYRAGVFACKSADRFAVLLLPHPSDVTLGTIVVEGKS